jgi:hypothetical protein
MSNKTANNKSTKKTKLIQNHPNTQNGEKNERETH